MYYLDDFCFLCLESNKNTTSQNNNCSEWQEKLEYFIPKHILQRSNIPKHICDYCIENINNIHKFRVMCLKNIAIFNECIQKLTQAQDLSVVLNDILHRKRIEMHDESNEFENTKEESNNCNMKLEKDEFEINEETWKDIENENSGMDSYVNLKKEILENYDSSSQRDIEINENIGNLLQVLITVEDETDNIEKNDTNEEVRVKVEPETDFNELGTKEDLQPRESSDNFHFSFEKKPTKRNKDLHGCEVCGKSFTCRSKLNRHKNVHNEKRFECDVCLKRFIRNDHLRKHKLTHFGEKSFECDVCLKKFTRVDHLKRHKLTHSDEKPYACHFCEKSFHRLDHLEQHKRTHNNVDEIFSCDVCAKTFNRRERLFNHKLSHKDKKQFECDVCSKKFKRSELLLKHKLKHSDGKPYSCNLCDKIFVKPLTLKTHQKKYHNLI